MRPSEANMPPTNCIVCLQKSAKVPLKYIEFYNLLLKKLLHGLSKETNRFKSRDYISFQFCTHCRVYLMKFAQLNDKLESLAGDLCRLEDKQKVIHGKISSVHRQVSNNGTDSQELNMQQNFRPLIRETLQPNEDSGTCDIEIFECGDSNIHVASESEDTGQSQSNHGAQNVNLQCLAPKMKHTDEDSADDKPARKVMNGNVEKISEKGFIFKGKYPFERIDSGFKCGICSSTHKLSKDKRQTSWLYIILHINKWHLGPDRVRKKQVHRKIVEIEPDRFQYGNYMFEKSDNKWQCLTCGKLAAIGRGRDKFKYISFHINHKHENPGKHHMCELCGTQFLSSMALKAHKMNKHAESNGPYPCGTCGKTFKSQIRLQRHEDGVHSRRSLKHMCEVCGKRFLSKDQLQGHIGFVHNGERIFKCTDCGKAYATSRSLLVHQNSHTGMRTYTCDVCGMQFSQSCHVTRHKKTAHKNSTP